jgi:hypothetical protein
VRQVLAVSGSSRLSIAACLIARLDGVAIGPSGYTRYTPARK